MVVHAPKLRRVLSDLDSATCDEDLSSPAYNLHVLQGNRDGERSMTVQKNWRVTFRWLGSNVELVNYEDYH